MIDDTNQPPAVVEDDAAVQPSAADPTKAGRINANPEDDERAALTLADYTAAGVEPPDWANDPMPSLDTWRTWQANESKALAHKRALAGK